jgi:putative oxidoreductase
MDDLAKLLGRILMAMLFIPAGWAKVAGYAGTAAYMEQMGVPGILLPLVILTELGGGIAVLLGAWTRWSAFALGGFSMLAAVLFHHDFSQGANAYFFFKDLAIGGGLMFLFASDPGRWSVDALLLKKR